MILEIKTTLLRKSSRRKRFTKCVSCSFEVFLAFETLMISPRDITSDKERLTTNKKPEFREFGASKRSCVVSLRTLVIKDHSGLNSLLGT